KQGPLTSNSISASNFPSITIHQFVFTWAIYANRAPSGLNVRPQALSNIGPGRPSETTCCLLPVCTTQAQRLRSRPNTTCHTPLPLFGKGSGRQSTKDIVCFSSRVRSPMVYAKCRLSGLNTDPQQVLAGN